MRQTKTSTNAAMRIHLLALLVLLSLSSAAGAQSTDPSNPTPWPIGGARGSGGTGTYYYSVNAGAGPMTVQCTARARGGSSSVTVEFSNGGRDIFASGGAIGTTDGGRGEVTVNVPRPSRLLVTITLLGDSETWAVTLNPQPYRVNIGDTSTIPTELPTPHRPSDAPPAPFPGTGPLQGAAPDGSPWPGLTPGSTPPAGTGTPPMRGPVIPGAQPWTGTYSGPWPDRYQPMHFTVTSNGGPLTVEVSVTGTNANITAFIVDPTATAGSAFPLGGGAQANAYTTGPTTGRATYTLQRGVYVLQVVVSHGGGSFTATVTTR